MTMGGPAGSTPTDARCSSTAGNDLSITSPNPPSRIDVDDAIAAYGCADRVSSLGSNGPTSSANPSPARSMPLWRSAQAQVDGLASVRAWTTGCDVVLRSRHARLRSAVRLHGRRRHRRRPDVGELGDTVAVGAALARVE